MEVRVLGPVSVEGADRRPERKHRALLARLAAAAPRAVATGDLIEVLWSERLPVDPAHALQHVVWGLRSCHPSAEHAIRRTAGGYWLDSACWPVDAQLAGDEIAAGEAALAAGDPVVADQLLTSALVRWRGVPFGEFCDAPDLAAERERLDDLALSAREAQAAALRQLGRFAEASALVRWLTATAPHRPRVQALVAAYEKPSRPLPAPDAEPVARASSLSRSEHELLARLPVFPTSFSLAAAEVVCADRQLQASDLRGAFAALAAAGIIAPDGSRFRLGTVRQGHVNARFRSAHARWLLSAAPAQRGAQPIEQVPDVIAALRHAAATGDAELCAGLTAAFGRSLDAAAQPAVLVPLLDVLDSDPGSPEERLAALLWSAHFAAVCGEGARVRRRLQAAVTLAREGGGSERGRAAAVGAVLARRSKSPAAIELARTAVGLLATSEPHELAYALSAAAPAHLAAGDGDSAQKLARQAADIYEQLGDRQGLGWALTTWACAESAGGRPARAGRRAREAVAIAVDIGDEAGAARALEAAAEADVRLGSPERALGCLSAAATLDHRRAGERSHDLRRVVRSAARVRARTDQKSASDTGTEGAPARQSLAALLAL